MRELWRSADDRPRVYGHRGTRGRPGVMENTLEAFELALDQGADGVELDVRLCGSGELVVLHDPDLTRTAGQALVAAEAPLQALAAAGVPTLEAALELVADKGGVVNVEAKPDVPDRDALVDALVRLLSTRSQEQRGQVFLSSFSRGICRALSEVLPDVPVLWLFGKPPQQLPLLSDLPAVVGVHPKHTLIDAETLPRYREGASVVNAWTVNDPAEARRLSELGVDGLITDDVPALLEALGEVDPV